MQASEDTYGKRALRGRLREIRDGLAPDVPARVGRRTAELLFASELVRGCRHVMLYAAIGNEVETRHFFFLAHKRGMRVAYPRVIKGERRMEAVWVDHLDELAPGVMGIPEPKPDQPAIDPGELELVVVPGLGFDRYGNRLGYGAGHYDRFLPDCPATRVGLTYDVCMVSRIPTDRFDQPMDWLLTETGLRSAKRSHGE